MPTPRPAAIAIPADVDRECQAGPERKTSSSGNPSQPTTAPRHVRNGAAWYAIGDHDGYHYGTVETYDPEKGRTLEVLETCGHRHRTVRATLDCAAGMLRRRALRSAATDPRSRRGHEPPRVLGRTAHPAAAQRGVGRREDLGFG
jgi:hypothetical protein